jgi:hypothetical protein
MTFFGAIIIIAIFGAAVYFILQKQERDRLINTFGEDIMTLCERPVTGDTGSFNNVPRLEPLYFLVLEGSEKSDWHDDVPSNMQAETREQLNVVACIYDEREVALEECYYTNLSTINRVGWGRYVTLYNPDTLQLMMRFDVHGAPPPSCELMNRSDTGDVKVRKGSKPDGDDFVSTLMMAVRR